MPVKLSLNVTTSPNLDDLLLDIATAIELSPRDRRVIESRYRRLKDHLERPGGPLAPYLVDSESRIYPQGSVAIGTTVITGKDDDSFDLDALVEANIPSHWSPKQVLDLLFEALKDFPDALKVVRCTRCVQLQFAFMHMDVTIMDPQHAPRVERAGEIFHSPDKGVSERVPANPYGFGQWFRAGVVVGTPEFTNSLQKHRETYAIDRLSLAEGAMDAIEQDDLPPVLPPRLDSEQVVAHKLMKRYVYQKYMDRDIKKPPTIYLAKLAVDAGPTEDGLLAQLTLAAQYVLKEMQRHLVENCLPDERNPTYRPDRLNDRWPKDRHDMEMLAGDMRNLIGGLERAKYAEFTQVVRILSELFGEKVSKRTVEKMLERAEVGAKTANAQYERNTGAVILPGTVKAPSVARSVSSAPQHNFHCEVLEKKE